MSGPLVSVVTPTWQRHDLLLDRCVPSVRAQTYKKIEHIIVSDGPDPVLTARLPNGWKQHVVYDELPEHDPKVPWGTRARLRALELARGDIIAYLDDDDAWRPEHAGTLVRALADNPDASVGWTKMAVHQGGKQIGQLGGAPSYGRVASSQLFHRRWLLGISSWRDEGPLHDWLLVERWIVAGAGYVPVDAETADYYRERAVEPGVMYDSSQ